VVVFSAHDPVELETLRARSAETDARSRESAN
jgi:hypothetical protein